MSKKSGSCMICGGGPTVKSHLFPRALTLDIRGDAASVVEGSRFQDGYSLRQNGIWDDELLCEEHEKKSGLGEKYSIELIRSLPTKAVRQFENAWALPNPRPELLAHFVHATVWKFAVSRYGRANDLSLGRYEKELRSRVFEGADPDLQFLVGRHKFVLSEKRVPIGIPPHRRKLGDLGIWLFVIGGLQFHLKTDKRPFPTSWQPYLGNGNDPLILTDGFELDILELPMLRPIIQRMLARKRR